MVQIRRMELEDVGAVNRVQCSAYPPSLWEHPRTLVCKLVAHSAGCLVGEDADGTVWGYILTHPWALSRTPPALNGGELTVPTAPTADCLYIHDMAVHPAFQGGGYARYIFRSAYAHALASGLGAFALVAVDGAHSFWAKLGFADAAASLAPAAQQYVRDAYGPAARYMVKQVDQPEFTLSLH